MDKPNFSRTIFVLALCAATGFAQNSILSENIDQILQRVDQFRGLQKDHQSNLTIEIMEGDAPQTSSSYMVRVHPESPSRSVLLRSLTPEVERGNLILSRSSEMWILTRKTSRAIPISVQQRLLGDASIGDILNVDFQGRYQGSVADSGQFLFLDLQAKTPDAVYERIQMRIRPRDGRPIQANFLTRSGRLLKTMRYRGFVRTNNQEIASLLEIHDALHTLQWTRVRFAQFQPVKFPPGMFDKNNLRTLQSTE
jgi:hypothetical protein